jgi:capsular polysaccharide biosynthesis protein
MKFGGYHTISSPGGRGHKVMAVLRRRFVTGLLLLVIVAAVAAAYASASPKKYSGEAVLVVPATSAGQLPPGNPDGAAKLAKTLATLIPNDRAILTAAGQRAGLTPDQVAKHLTVTNDANTALLRLDYIGSTPVGTVTVLNALATALTSTNPPGPIDAGSLRTAKLAQSVTPTGHNARTALPLGFALGLVVALLAAIVLERSTPRVDGPAELGDLTGRPVTTWDSLSESGVLALVSRWTTMVDLPRPSVALVGVGRARHDLLLRVADQIESLARSGRRRVMAQGTAEGAGSTLGTDQADAFTLRIADMSDREASADDIAQVADMTVLVVPVGTKVATVAGIMRRLENYGVTPSWAVMLGRSDLLGRRQ